MRYTGSGITAAVVETEQVTEDSNARAQASVPAIAPAHDGEYRSLTQIITAKLRKGIYDGSIFDGEYGPGSRLNIASLAKRLDVSPIPVREALRRLEAEGLVEFTRWAGARVAGFDARQLGEAIAAAAMLEAEIALLACPGLEPADLAAMREANEQLRAAEAHGDMACARDSDRAFHAVMHDRCPNRMLVTLVQIAYTRMDTVQNIYEHRPERIPAAARDHDRLVELLSSTPDPQEVALAFRRHGLRAAEEIAGR